MSKVTTKGKHTKKGKKTKRKTVNENDDVTRQETEDLAPNTTGSEFTRQTSTLSDMFPDRPYTASQSPLAENGESGALGESNGLSKLQQLSVDKKLKYLEPPVYFYDLPESRPMAMVFEYTGTDMSHLKVVSGIMATLESIPHAKVTSIQFVARNVILGTMWVDNRWIVELSTRQCVTVLLGRGIHLNGEPVKLRKYDDVMKEDYEKFLQNKSKFDKKTGGGKKLNKNISNVPTDALSLLSTVR